MQILKIAIQNCWKLKDWRSESSHRFSQVVKWSVQCMSCMDCKRSKLQRLERKKKKLWLWWYQIHSAAKDAWPSLSHHQTEALGPRLLGIEAAHLAPFKHATEPGIGAELDHHCISMYRSNSAPSPAFADWYQMDSTTSWTSQ